jgi:hypothetical protein
MKALELLEQYWQEVKKLFAYIQYCAEADMQTPVCRDLWLWSVCLAVGVGLVIAFVIAKTVFRGQLEFFRNRKRLAARQIVADEETMNEAKWKGDDDANTELSQEQLAARMRDAMKVRAELHKRSEGAGMSGNTTPPRDTRTARRREVRLIRPAVILH